MTLAEAQLILKTYRLPMTAQQMVRFKIAFAVACGLALRNPNG